MQIYKGLDIATAKVTKAEMQNIPHHLIDICEPQEKFSVADFKRMCYDEIDKIIKKGKVPIIVGGTGLYVSSVVYDMNFDKEAIDEEYRKYLYDLAKEKSNMYVYNMLEKVDKESAKEIHPNNLKRVIRALEIAKNSEKLKSEHIEDEKSRLKNLKKDSKYNFQVFYIDYNRDTLYKRINERVDIMIKDGLEKEAKMVYDMNLPKDVTCMQAIGYKEFFPYFNHEISLDEVILKLKLETRKYAKRQETYFKNKLEVILLDGTKTISEKVSYIKERLSN